MRIGCVNNFTSAQRDSAAKSSRVAGFVLSMAGNGFGQSCRYKFRRERVVHATALWRGVGRVFIRRLSRRVAGNANVLFPRLRRAGVSVHLPCPGKLLARGVADVESAQQLRTAISGAMGHDGAVSVFLDLLAAAAAVVAFAFLLCSFAAGRAGHVLAGPSVDKERTGGQCGGHGFCLQRLHVLLSDLAELRRRAGLDAVDRGIGRTSLARRGRMDRGRGPGVGSAIAERRAGDRHLDLVGDWHARSAGRLVWQGARRHVPASADGGVDRLGFGGRPVVALPGFAGALSAAKRRGAGKMVHARVGLGEFARAAVPLF